MKQFLFLLLAILTGATSAAHPGIGIVKDSKGNIYYTDLKQVWKISGGKRSVVVTNVHSHELYIDSADNLYGEHLWYNGERLNTWGYYIWCLPSDGSLVRLKQSDGFREDYSFVRDDRGNMYWVERWKISRFKKKTPDGRVSLIAEGKFRDVRWMHCTKDGRLYFLDLEKLYVIADNKVRLLAEDLNEFTAAFTFVGKRHNAYGIWTDTADNVYIALYGGQRVKKITPEGEVSTLLHSASPWSPTSGVFDNEGNLWLQEYKFTGECRVRKIGKSELEKERNASAFVTNDFLPIVIAGTVVFVIMQAMRRIPFSARQK